MRADPGPLLGAAAGLPRGVPGPDRHHQLAGPARRRARRGRTGARRLACFGDSITFGYGVGDEETYAVPGRPRARARSGDRGGQRGRHRLHEPSGARPAWRRLADQAPFDVATVCIGWNDGTWRPVDDREYGRRLAAVGAVEGLADRLYLYRALKGVYVRALVRDVQEQRRTTRRVPLPQYHENLAAIVSACRSRQAPSRFVGLPHRHRAGDAPLGPDLRRARWRRRRETWACRCSTRASWGRQHRRQRPVLHRHAAPEPLRPRAHERGDRAAAAGAGDRLSEQ